MSPLLFLQYINDMLKHIKHILNNQLFADVTTVYRQITTAEKSGFSFTIGCWMGMSFHPKKFHLLNFYKNRTDMCHSYDIRDHTLNTVTLFEDMTWKGHLDRHHKRTPHHVFAPTQPISEAIQWALIQGTSEVSAGVLQDTLGPLQQMSYQPAGICPEQSFIFIENS